MSHPWYLNVISFLGIFGLCAIAWLFSEHKRVIPWRVIIWGIGLQLVLAFLVFQFPPTRTALEWFSNLLNGVFEAADFGARFVFGGNIVPKGNPPVPVGIPPVNLGYIFAFRALPTVIFFSGLMALLYNIGVIQIITEIFAKLFYWTMRLSGAEALSGAANIFVGIEAAIVVKPYLPKMTRSELAAILACCFGTAASSTLAIYVSFLKPVFPNILGHLVSASIIAIPACFVISKILVPETGVPVTLGGIPSEKQAKEFEQNEFEEYENQDKPKQETVGGEPIERVSPLDAAIVGSLDGVKMAVAIAAVLILILGLVSLINQFFGWLAGLPGGLGDFFKIVTLQNIEGALFYPLTILTGVPLSESWEASVIIGRRLLETAIPPYQALAEAAQRPVNPLSDRTVLIVSYALSGFAHLASVGIFVGGTIALIPSRRKDISELGWKALFAGTLGTLMIACLAGVFDTGDPSILGVQGTPASITAPAASPTLSPVPGATVSPVPTSTPVNPAITPLPATTISPEPTATPGNPAVAPSPATRLQAPATKPPATPRTTTTPKAIPSPRPPATPRATTPPKQAPQPKPTASAVPSPSP
ncbi:nucleoside transporter C-terminal domain-containing protein [Coleofasciculus sp. FACHB-1120]|uniref:NupC/NupG family nucleoside CNT transporter n=1 Tax=Coleofasciculus sp. FACHB-1120 TaxID=2692783 RepID=UPI0016882C38|nr:nucleoside transporter C-terminal domain-containing protein [Coleofasciculus sp. FACHB-1120]MBD2742810.1 nucleoside:proton symporter [Coleofasciculus sp. FACHB-1120]